MSGQTLVLIPSGIECQHLLFEEAVPILETPFRAWRSAGITWAVCGVGATAAAMTAAHLIPAMLPDRVVLAGIAGAFRSEDLHMAQVVQIVQDQLADIGFEHDGEWINLDDIGLPILQGQHRDYGCTFDVSPFDDELPTVKAVTVNRITASEQRAALLWDRFGAQIEQMEGAGVALACNISDVPFFHVRAISNWVGPRNPATWHIDAACTALKSWLRDRL